MPVDQLNSVENTCFVCGTHPKLKILIRRGEVSWSSPHCVECNMVLCETEKCGKFVGSDGGGWWLLCAACHSKVEPGVVTQKIEGLLCGCQGDKYAFNLNCNQCCLMLSQSGTFNLKTWLAGKDLLSPPLPDNAVFVPQLVPFVVTIVQQHLGASFELVSNRIPTEIEKLTEKMQSLPFVAGAIPSLGELRLIKSKVEFHIFVTVHNFNPIDQEMSQFYKDLEEIMSALLFIRGCDHPAQVRKFKVEAAQFGMLHGLGRTFITFKYSDAYPTNPDGLQRTSFVY